jgi:hypothetical protein
VPSHQARANLRIESSSWSPSSKIPIFATTAEKAVPSTSGQIGAAIGRRAMGDERSLIEAELDPILSPPERGLPFPQFASLTKLS